MDLNRKLFCWKKKVVLRSKLTMRQINHCSVKFIYSEKATKFYLISTVLALNMTNLRWPSQNIWTLIGNFKKWTWIETYHEPKPFKQGTSNGKGSNFVKSILMTRSEGKSTLINWFMSILISPGIGIVSGLLPPITTKSASSYPSALG